MIILQEKNGVLFTFGFFFYEVLFFQVSTLPGIFTVNIFALSVVSYYIKKHYILLSICWSEECPI